MKASEALEIVAREYVPGIVTYYGRMSNDPWQDAHDELEPLMATLDEDLISAGCERFVARARELIRRFREAELPAQSVRPDDAFAIGDKKRVKDWQSVRHQECAVCSTRDNLTLEPTGDNGALEVRVVCRQHKGAA